MVLKFRMWRWDLEGNFIAFCFSAFCLLASKWSNAKQFKANLRAKTVTSLHKTQTEFSFSEMSLCRKEIHRAEFYLIFQRHREKTTFFFYSSCFLLFNLKNSNKMCVSKCKWNLLKSFLTHSEQRRLRLDRFCGRHTRCTGERPVGRRPPSSEHLL